MRPIAYSIFNTSQWFHDPEQKQQLTSQRIKRGTSSKPSNWVISVIMSTLQTNQLIRCPVNKLEKYFQPINLCLFVCCSCSVCVSERVKVFMSVYVCLCVCLLFNNRIDRGLDVKRV